MFNEDLKTILKKKIKEVQKEVIKREVIICRNVHSYQGQDTSIEW